MCKQLPKCNRGLMSHRLHLQYHKWTPRIKVDMEYPAIWTLRVMFQEHLFNYAQTEFCTGYTFQEPRGQSGYRSKSGNIGMHRYCLDMSTVAQGLPYENVFQGRARGEHTPLMHIKMRQHQREHCRTKRDTAYGLLCHWYAGDTQSEARCNIIDKQQMRLADIYARMTCRNDTSDIKDMQLESMRQPSFFMMLTMQFTLCLLRTSQSWIQPRHFPRWLAP